MLVLHPADRNFITGTMPSPPEHHQGSPEMIPETESEISPGTSKCSPTPSRPKKSLSNEWFDTSSNLCEIIIQTWSSSNVITQI